MCTVHVNTRVYEEQEKGIQHFNVNHKYLHLPLHCSCIARVNQP